MNNTDNNTEGQGRHEKLNLFCDLLKIGYAINKIQNNGLICGSEAELIRDKLYAYIESEYLIMNKGE